MLCSSTQIFVVEDLVFNSKCCCLIGLLRNFCSTQSDLKIKIWSLPEMFWLLILSWFLIASAFLKRSGTKEKRSRASHYYADIAAPLFFAPLSAQLLRMSAGYSTPKTRGHKGHVQNFTALYTITQREAPKRKYTPSGSAQKMRHFHHFLASFYPLQKTKVSFFADITVRYIKWVNRVFFWVLSKWR